MKNIKSKLNEELVYKIDQELFDKLSSQVSIQIWEQTMDQLANLNDKLEDLIFDQFSMILDIQLDNV